MPPLGWLTDWLSATDVMHVMLVLGVLMLAALFAGLVGSYIRLPKVTSFLLIGVALGSIIPKEHKGLIEHIEPLTKLAIALVLFNLGCHFPFAKVRRIVRRVCRLSFGELGVTFLLVTAGILLLGARWEVALLLGVLALATAPATTILVLKETESEGSLTEYTNGLVAVNNLVSIVLFELLFLGIIFWHGQLGSSSLSEQLGHLVQDLLGSVALGVVAGLAVSYAFGLVAESRRLALLVGLIMLVLAVASIADMPYLLVFLAMGTTVANSSYQTRQVLAELDRLTGLLCVVFFVTHGAELELGKLGEAGIIGIGYLVFRSCGKYLGIRLACRSEQEEPAVRNWLGTALVAQAGAAITLAHIAVENTEGMPGILPKLCLEVQTIILGTVVVFEIAGPLLIRNAVFRAGEVPLAHAIHHPGASLLDQARTVYNGLLMAFGLNPWGGRSEADLTVKEIMRGNVQTVPHSATFDEVVDCLEHNRDNTFPVVDTAGELVGVIRYRELSHAMFDRDLGSLVRAADVTTPARVLHPEEPLTKASAIFAKSKDDCIPVVDADEPHRFLGMIRRRDVLRLLARDRK